ncbi:ThuA domain-containing protein [Zhongshania aquimaris]|uniref:ThuA domain-containing protein n=1 Tax=Zhongshania aquimaris TaxID=2857107 RepID=A0ABS6VVS2_9GAMM|nr:ThuA domain-containing protein [Zhongshania aquimaris]MBW2942427.1 ThuA domain-containing protein [Zhongshania aquimaris]
MSRIDYTSDLKLLISVKGHPYDRNAFAELFENIEDVSYTIVEQPASQAMFSPILAKDYDVHVLYDMPGLDFTTQPPSLIDPPEKFVSDFEDLLELGHGLLFLHHSIASWPTWPKYAEIVGGRFLYVPSELRGRPCMDSGYRHDVTYTAKTHSWGALADGVPDTFSMTDELYLYEVFEQDVIPLLSGNYPPISDNFYSAAHAGLGRMFSNADWPHPQGSNYLAWAKSYKNSPIVYIQMGDGPSAYENPHFQKILSNAIAWLGSAESLAWAKKRNQS